MRVTFSKCLNIEPKIYNISYVSLAGGISFGIIGAVFYGLLGFFGAFIFGFVIGKKVGEGWWSGDIQRYIYWNLPSFFTLAIIGKAKRLPPSHARSLL